MTLPTIAEVREHLQHGEACAETGTESLYWQSALDRLDPSSMVIVDRQVLLTLTQFALNGWSPEVGEAWETLRAAACPEHRWVDTGGYSVRPGKMNVTWECKSCHMFKQTVEDEPVIDPYEDEREA